MLKKHASWLLPILLMIAITPFTPYLDFSIEEFFYRHGSGNPEHFISNWFCDFMYDYGEWPGLGTGFVAAALLMFSYVFPYLKKTRMHALFLVLVLVIGPGFITNALLKEHWGRPRPKQVEEFGGTQSFRPFYKPNFFDQPEPSKSFTCGHCTMGFYFFALAIVGRRIHSKSLYLSGMALAWFLGISLSIVRMAQGGHFLSDTLMSALLMWLTCLVCEWLVYGDKSEAPVRN
jgi:membrane-associated PAP2 superfamily phosphatase